MEWSDETAPKSHYGEARGHFYGSGAGAVALLLLLLLREYNDIDIAGEVDNRIKTCESSLFALIASESRHHGSMDEKQELIARQTSFIHPSDHLCPDFMRDIGYK